MKHVLAANINHQLLEIAIVNTLADGSDFNMTTDHKLYTDENGFAWLAFHDETLTEIDPDLQTADDVAAEAAVDPQFRTYVFEIEDGTYSLETNI